MFFEEAIRAIAENNPDMTVAQAVAHVDTPVGDLPPASDANPVALATWALTQPEIVEQVKKMHGIHAIKAIRFQTGASLYNSKTAYEIAKAMLGIGVVQ